MCTTQLAYRVCCSQPLQHIVHDVKYYPHTYIPYVIFDAREGASEIAELQPKACLLFLNRGTEEAHDS